VTVTLNCWALLTISALVYWNKGKRYSGADLVGNFGAESSVVHQQNVEVSDVVDDEFLQAVGEMESGFLIVTVTDLWHWLVASESSSHSVVDTCAKPHNYLLVFSNWQPIYRRTSQIGIW